MRSAATATGIVLVLMTVVSVLWREVEIRRSRARTEDLLRECLASNLDDESLLACGRPVPFSTIDEVTLELLPGISQVRSRALIEARPEIIRHAELLSTEDCMPGSCSQPLEIAAMIGPLTAKALAPYLVLKPVVPSHERSRPPPTASSR